MENISWRYYSILICLALVINSYAENISITTSKDSLYLYDDFAIEESVLTNDNGSTGFGWSNNWTYQTGHSDGVAVGNEFIYTTKSAFGANRNLINPIKFVGSTYYVSFLFKKDISGIFRLSGHRASDQIDRFGIHIKVDGKLGAQAGTSYDKPVLSEESLIENDIAYLVVAKYYFTTKPNMNISVYSAGDLVPSEEPQTWDLEAEGTSTGMEAIDYFRLAFTSATVYIDELKIGDTWKSVSTTDIATAFPAVPVVEIANSDVQVIDQESTTDAKTWTYSTEEPGDYQLGFAWIWVEGVNNEVDLEVKSGGKTIKSFIAKSAIAPYRFETRFENLTEGEQISVTATPKNGASYRLSYRLAYATPTFTGVDRFDVASYGAVGDGITNDFQAIKDALKAAEKAGGGIVEFDGTKTYYVEGPQNYALFDFFNSSNIKAEGNGAKIILHPNGNFIRMDNAENIQIDGFTTTYDPLPYYQGKITAMYVNELFLDMQVEARYDAPVTGKYRQISDIFGRSFWVTIPGTKMGEGRHLSIDSTAQIGNDDHAIRVFLQYHETADLSASKSQNATDFIIPHKDYGHTTGWRDSPYCGIKRSSRVKISNILTHSVCHFAYTIGGNFGPITFSNTDMLAPGEEDMHVVWRDGWHVWGNRYGIMIEDGDFDAGYMYDDVFSPHVMVPIVESVSGTTVRLKSKPTEYYEKYTDKPVWQVGDLVSFWDENQTVYYGMGRILEVNQTESLSLIDITLDSVISEAVAGTYAINEETLNRDMVVRNCTSSPKGRNTAVRQRTPILYKDCNFQNIHFWTYCGEPWRTRPRNVVFENCYINERHTFNVDDTWNLTIKNCTLNIGQVDVSNTPRIVMDSIYFTNMSGEAIKLRDGSHGYVFGDYAYNGNPSDLETKYSLDITSSINFSEPKVYPSFAPPFLIEEEPVGEFEIVKEPFDFSGTVLTNAGSGQGWYGTWTSTGAGIGFEGGESLLYPRGISLNSSGGRIMHSSGFSINTRRFAYPVSLASGTYYFSFLAKKSSGGSFKIETNNSSNHIRFGIEVAADGTVTAKSGLGNQRSNSGLFLNDTTYFVLIKFTNEGSTNAVTRVKLYKNGDQIPADDSEIAWDVVTEPMLTGVDQEMLMITIEGGTVELDEILIGTSYNSVSYDENYVPVNIDKKLSSHLEPLIIQNLPSGVNVLIPGPGGKLILFDTTGRQLFSQRVNETTYFLGDAILKKSTGIKIIRYQTVEKNYTAKVFR